MRFKHSFIILFLLLLAPPQSKAQLRWVMDSTSAAELLDTSRKTNLVQWFQRWRYRAQTSGYDTTYIAFPRESPWMFKVITDVSDLRENSGFNFPDYVKGSLRCHTDLRAQLKVGAYYRGWGLAFNLLSLNQQERDLSLSFNGRVFGLSGSLGKYAFTDNTISFIDSTGKPIFELNSIKDSIDINGVHNTWAINTYFVFKPKRFSYPAVITQTIWQLKSSGSMLATLSYQGGRTTFDHNAVTDMLYADRFYIESHNLVLGVGYGYTWVLGAGDWMLHASAIPNVRWAFKTTLDVKRMEGWNDLTPEQQALYSNKNFADYIEGRNRWSFGGLARLCAMHNFGPHWAAGLMSTFTVNYRGSSQFNTSLFDWSVRLYGCYRF